MLLIMYQIFSSLLGHLPFSVQFFPHFYGVTFFGTPNITNFCDVKRRQVVKFLMTLRKQKPLSSRYNKKIFKMTMQMHNFAFDHASSVCTFDFRSILLWCVCT